MPRGDRTGPNGAGPMTGRRMGYCTGNDQPGFGRWFGFGSGRGRGYGRGFFNYQNRFPDNYPDSLSGENASILEGEIRSLKSAMNNILDRLNSLKKNKDDSGKEK